MFSEKLQASCPVIVSGDRKLMLGEHVNGSTSKDVLRKGSKDNGVLSSMGIGLYGRLTERGSGGSSGMLLVAFFAASSVLLEGFSTDHEVSLVSLVG